MTLSTVGWMSGLSASGVVISGIMMGLYVIYESKKTNAKLLFYMGLMITFAALGWLGNLVDFETSANSSIESSSNTFFILETFPLVNTYLH